MKFAAFDALAREMFETVPEEFRRGIVSLLVHRRARRHRRIPDYFTLGECEPGTAGPEAGEWASRIHLYHGSFRALARRDEAFEEEEELWETILHEIRHDLEDRAGARALLDEDEAEEQNERRRAGLPFEPGFYRKGERGEGGEWWVGPDCFLEVPLSRRDWRRLAGQPHPIRWGEDTFEVRVPREPAEAVLVPVEGGWEDEEKKGGDLLVAFALHSALPLQWVRREKAGGKR
ncbi:MAG TPA: hypothetical protein VFI25_13735 [Planctomycetota bacterium]|nr:hypothetical protein [Planctomycetota bacterium]